MVNMNTYSWEIPSTMEEDSILQSNYCLWSSFLVQSPHQHQPLSSDVQLEDELGAEKEMTYRIAAMQPVVIEPSALDKPKRRNVWISQDPQSVAARQRRERISEKIRILQRLVPGGTKMDTATMLDEAIQYIKFLKRVVRSLQSSWDPSIPVLFGDPLQILVASSSSSSMDHFITWSDNSEGEGGADIYFNH